MIRCVERSESRSEFSKDSGGAELRSTHPTVFEQDQAETSSKIRLRHGKQCDFGLIGLAVMGENLALNVESRGFRVAVFNRTTSKVDDFIAGRGRRERTSSAATRWRSWSAASARPRKVMLMVKAGPAVDEFIEQAASRCSSPGDVIIDGGNTLLQRHRAADRPTSSRRGCCTSARASPAARKGP